MNPTKPGILSSEFWIMIVPQLLLILELLGVIPATDKDMLGGLGVQIVTGLVAAVALYAYIKGRVAVKQAAIDAAAASVDEPLKFK
jgi:hypothetical protein